MDFEENRSDQPVDPDPFEAINLIINAAAAVGSLISAAIAYKALAHGNISQPRRLEEDLMDRIRDAIRTAERMVRLLAQTQIGPQTVLELEFRYGNQPMLLNLADFTEYSRLCEKLYEDARSIHSHVMAMLRFSPERAHDLGLALIAEKLDVPDRINGYYRSGQSTGQVLDDALDLLRSYERLLSKFTLRN